MNPRTRTQMLNRQTSYEVVANTPDGRIRLGFLARVNKHTLLKVAQRPENSSRLLHYMSDDDPSATYSRDNGWTLGPITIRLSGRTERDCANEEGRM